MYELAAFRAFQGIGAGGLMSLALAIIGDIVPPRERARYQGMFLAVFGTSSVLGPVIGGALAGQSSILGLDGWRWVFLVNVPIGIAAFAVVAVVLNLPRKASNVKRRIDWLGSAFISIGLVPLLIVAEQGRDWGWTSQNAWICYVVGALGLIAFVIAEHYAKDDALIPLRLFRNSVFSLTSLTGLIVGMAMFGGIAMIPQYLQIVKGNTPTQSGLLMLPFVLGLMLSSMGSGLLIGRTGRYKIYPIIGTVLIAVAAGLFAYRLEWDSSLVEVDIYMAIFGIGLGLCMQTLTLATQNAVPPRDMGVATASATFFRSMGGTLGTAVFISLLFSTVGDKIGDAFRAIVPTQAFQTAIQTPSVVQNPVNAPLFSALKGGGAGGALQDSSFIQQLNPPILAQPFQEGFTNAMHIVFLSAAIIAAVAFVLTLVTKEVPLRTQSGIQAQAAEDGVVLLAPEPESVPAAVASATEPFDTNGRHSLNGNGHSHLEGSLLLGTPVRGFVRRPDGSPVDAAALTVIDLNGKQVGRTVSGQDGGYDLAAPANGTYVLIASAGSHQPQASTVVVNGAPVDFDVVLAGTGGLVGVVTALGGAPVVEATVTLADTRGEVVGSRSTDVGGSYQFRELVGGDYTLVVSAASHRPTALPVRIGDSGTTRQDVELAGGATLEGVARGVDGLPLADARVTLVAPDGAVVAVATTGTDGQYNFGDLAEGDYTVIASGYPPVAAALRVTAGQEAVHDVELGFPE
jgi:EmrB/QacA subfamily drug resistance transporter